MQTSPIVLGSLLTLLLTFTAPAQPSGVFKFEAAEVSKVFEAYRVITGLELVIASNVEKAPPFKITLQSKRETTAKEAARMIERALLEQAGVVITHLEDGRISVTYNDALKIRLPKAKLPAQ